MHIKTRRAGCAKYGFRSTHFAGRAMRHDDEAIRFDVSLVLNYAIFGYAHAAQGSAQRANSAQKPTTFSSV